MKPIDVAESWTSPSIAEVATRTHPNVEPPFTHMKRRPYSTPHLITYGSVRELTTGGVGSKKENGSTICGATYKSGSQSC